MNTLDFIIYIYIALQHIFRRYFGKYKIMEHWMGSPYFWLYLSILQQRKPYAVYKRITECFLSHSPSTSSSQIQNWCSFPCLFFLRIKLCGVKIQKLDDGPFSWFNDVDLIKSQGVLICVCVLAVLCVP